MTLFFQVKMNFENVNKVWILFKRKIFSRWNKILLFPFLLVSSDNLHLIDSLLNYFPP